jgi:hypothetical protein
MATNGGRSSTPPNYPRRSNSPTSKKTLKYNFRVQSAPPLSLQHFLRSATGVIVGAKQWQHPGKYRPPKFNAYLSSEVRPKKKIVEPVWHPPGRYREKRPTSLSPEKIKRERTPEPVWHPAGKTQHKPVPYFDPPSLRWSLQELLRSMPKMRPKPFHASRSMSALSKSKEVQNT